MRDVFFFVGLPYLALAVMVLGTLYRFRSARFGVSALSSQVLEHRALAFGSIPWHAGVLVLLVGHLVPFLAPGLWQALVSNRAFLLGVEAVGVAAAILAAVGLSVLLVRRLTAARLQAVTTGMDLAVLTLLLLQVLLGLVVATRYRYGASWATGTVMPYLWSLLKLQPDMTLVSEMPAIVKLHLTGAWLIFLLVPFSRLVHAFSVPVHYLFRAPQRVIWTTLRRVERLRALPGGDPAEGRRSLLQGALGMVAAGLMLSAGVLDKFVRFFRGDAMTRDQKQKLMAERLERVKLTSAQRELELERMRSDAIPIGKLADLKDKSGTYFIDYQMRPALAFKDEQGLPRLISAKCTHLGCTVGSEVDEQGRILCPCHISYFDIKTGQPHDGAPAKLPLPMLGWVLKDAGGKVVARKKPGGPVEGAVDPATLATCTVCIARDSEEESA